MPENRFIAIDIALLLPDAANERVRAVNKAMLAAKPEGLRFDATHLPHITLAQMFVQRVNLPALIGRIDPILGSAPPLALFVSGVGSGNTTAHLVIEPNPALRKLHEQLMDAVQPFEEAGGGSEAFHSDGEPPRAADIAWVTRFRTNASYGNFHPHITVGAGPPQEFREPFGFTIGRATVCHLGRFCTCRIVLREWTFGTEVS